jgi:hypothetical protein
MDIAPVLSAIKYGITSGSQFMWDCYGPHAWALETETVSIVADRETGRVYELAIHDWSNDINYRWIDPDYINTYINESTVRGFDPWQVYDDARYIRVDNDEEIMKMLFP